MDMNLDMNEYLNNFQYQIFFIQKLNIFQIKVLCETRAAITGGSAATPRALLSRIINYNKIL